MAYVWADRVLETSTTTGTGALALAGAVSKYRTFASVCSVADTLPYAIVNLDAAEWEVGLGTYSAANQLTRTTVQASSNAGAAVNFSAGTKRVGLGTTAAATLASQNNLSDLGSAATARTNLGLVAGGAGDIWVEKAGDTMTGALLIVNSGGVTISADSSGVYIDQHVSALDVLFLKSQGPITLQSDYDNDTGNNWISFEIDTSEKMRISSSGDLQMGGTNTVIDSNRLHRLRQYTVATLPTVGTAGRLAAVTDATAPTYNGALTGGGAVNVPVYDNGAAWVSH